MNKLKTLSGAQLKYIAFTTMLIDHVNKALIYPNLNGGILLVISDIFDILGRIAFPIFIFLLIEGYFRTTNRRKYLGMLLLFGIISEIPYDMFTTASYFEPNGNNIMFTLGAGQQKKAVFGDDGQRAQSVADIGDVLLQLSVFHLLTDQYGQKNSRESIKQDGNSDQSCHFVSSIL